MDAALARIDSAPGDSFADALVAGLLKAPKQISAKYFYDAAGSKLFDEICELPEYYQTRTETMLLQRHAPEIAALMGRDVEIVEFGAGALRKVRILLEAAQPRAYLPLDISGDYLRQVVRDLAVQYPALQVAPVVPTSPCRWTFPAMRAAPDSFPAPPSAISVPRRPLRCCGACAAP